MNMPHLTDAGAKDFGARATKNMAKFVPSQTTTLVVCLLGFCWLGIKLYKEIKSGQVHHTPNPPPPT